MIKKFLGPFFQKGTAFFLWRNRLIGNPDFQRQVARIPLLRGIAQREAAALFDLCAGAVYAQTLVACLRLDVFERLAAAPLTAAALAESCNLPGAAALLEAATALRLAERHGPDSYRLGMLGAALRANPGIAAMVAHHDRLYDDLRDPVALLRAPAGSTSLAAYWAYAANTEAAQLGAESVGPYSALMAASQPMIAGQVLGAYTIARHRRLLDVGGGDGSFLIAAGRAAPRLELHLFDLPAVVARARLRFAAADLAARATCHGGDFRADSLPGGADLITFVRVLHDHDDATVRHLLAAARAALPPGGRVLIAEPMAETPSVAAYFSLYLHAMGSGRPRSAAQLATMLRDAGFSRPRRRRTALPLIAQVLIADCKS